MRVGPKSGGDGSALHPEVNPARTSITLSREPTCLTLNPPSFRLEVHGDRQGARWRAWCRPSLDVPFLPASLVRPDLQGRLGLEDYAAFLRALEGAGVWSAASICRDRAGGEVVTLRLRCSRRRHTVQWFELPGGLARTVERLGATDPGAERVRDVVNDSFIGQVWQVMRRDCSRMPLQERLPQAVPEE